MTSPTPPATEGPGRTRPSGLAARVAAVAEVLLAFCLVHLAYRSFKHFTDLGRLEVASGLNYSSGATMILFTAAVLLVRRASLAEYGLTLRGWRYDLNVGLLWTMVNVAAAVLVILLTPVHFDPFSPPDLPRAATASLGELALTVLLALFLRREWGPLRRVPAAAALALLAALLSLPLALAAASGRPILGVLASVLWLFFGAGFGEEVFFRGYIQSRLNEAFGRPFRLLGVDFGPGLLVSSLLFGFIHALNTVDYFEGRFDFAWLWMLVNFCSGLFFGILREKRGSVLPGVVLHGLVDVLGLVPSLLP